MMSSASRHVRVGPLALLAFVACARQHPPAATVAVPPVAAETANAAAPPRRPQVKTVAFAGDVIYTLSEDGRLRQWSDSSRSPVALDFDYVHALSADGAAAVTMSREGEYGNRVEVWDPATRTQIRARAFETGVESVLGISREAVVLLVNIPANRHPDIGEPALPAPQWRGTVWNFARELVDNKNMVENAEGPVDISADGQLLLFQAHYGSVQYVDLRQGRTWFPRIASDWRAPVPELVMPSKPKPPDPVPWGVLSARLDADGKDVYITYHGVSPNVGWRLERWTPGNGRDGGPIARLAATAEDGQAHVLAVSRDGRLVMMSHFGGSLTVRRAPGWRAQRLGDDAAAAAAVSPDGKRLVSGGFDGRLHLWDARTGKLLATAEPQD
jgi:WD40 repeat protein